VAVRRYFSTRTLLGARASAVRDAYAQTECTTISGTLFASAQLNRSSQADVSAGPVGGIFGCAGSYQYSALISVAPGRRTLVYVGSARTPSSGLQVGSTFESSSFGGFTTGDPRRLGTRFDAGYATYTLAQSTPTMPNLHGYFLSAELTRQVSTWSEISLTARFFSSQATGTDINRTIGFLTFHWSREQRPTHLDNLRDPNDIR